MVKLDGLLPTSGKPKSFDLATTRFSGRPAPPHDLTENAGGSALDRRCAAELAARDLQRGQRESRSERLAPVQVDVIGVEVELGQIPKDGPQRGEQNCERRPHGSTGAGRNGVTDLDVVDGFANLTETFTMGLEERVDRDAGR